MPGGSADAAHGAEILLLRHAPTGWNDEGRAIGWSDQPLSPAGHRALAAWSAPADASFAAVCSSDLGRAADSAAVIARRLGVCGTIVLPGLREQEQGVWTGLTKAEIRRRWPARSRARPRDPVHGEPPAAVIGRVARALGVLAVWYPGRRVLAVTHGQVIRMLEEAVGAASPPVGHLHGRWVTVSPAAGRGRRPAAAIRPGAMTAGRTAEPAPEAVAG